MTENMGVKAMGAPNDTITENMGCRFDGGP